MSINKYLPFALLYFFFNSLGLPAGLTYMALLSPFFYWWVINTRRKEILLPFLIFATPFVIGHLISGVNTREYIISFLNLTAIYIFCQAFYTFLIKCRDPGKIFRVLLVTNFILCLVAIPFYFTPVAEIFWIDQFLTRGINEFRRLKMFTYEASYYALVFTPLFLFFFLQLMLKQNRMSAWVLLPMLLLPYLLSFAIGVVGALCLALLLTYIFHFRTLTRKRRVLNLISLTTIAAFGLLLVLSFLPGNVVFTRLENIFEGDDLSGRSRTLNSFIIADKVLALKNELTGIGLGQLRLIGTDIIMNFYQYHPAHTSIAIPNVTAETWAFFGWTGIFLRFLAQVFLFFYTRVWTNYYRMALFLFIFLYQFTGSYITNPAEYVVWILAFTRAFPQFDARPKPIHA